MAPSQLSPTTTTQSPVMMIGSVSTESTVTLIPGLPNDVASLILSMIPYAHHSRLRPTCKSWNHFLSSTETLINLRLRHVSNTRSQLLCLFPQDPSISSPYLFDPHHRAWLPLPPMPCNPHVYGLCNFTSLSIGPHLYVIGGSLFDTRSFPLDRPSPSSSAFRFDFVTFDWTRLSPMRSPRGSFACAAIPELGRIIVAGGGSRHTLFAAAGSRMSSVEVYDVERDEWVSMDGLPRYRAGCVGFVKEREFWVMGGYGESRTVSGVLPVDEYYKDAVVMDLGCGGGWREVGDMWREGERARLGKIVVVDDYDDDEECAFPRVFMLDNDEIFRYDMPSNSWQKESIVPRKAPFNSSFGFIALGRELYVMTTLKGGCDSWTKTQRPRKLKRSATLFVQIYNPQKKMWRSLTTKPPFKCSLDFKTAVMCTVRL